MEARETLPRRGLRSTRADLAVALAVAVLAAVLIARVAWPVAEAVRAGLASPLVAGADLIALGLRSLALGLAASAITVGLALALGWALVRGEVPGGRVVAGILLAPLVAPPFLLALGLRLLAGHDGLLARMLGLDWSIEGFGGIVLAQVVTYLPLAWLVVARAIRTIDPALEEAAESLGAAWHTTLGRVTLVLVRPALLAAALLTLLVSLGDLANPMVIGGGHTVLATEIYARAVGGDPAGAATLALVLAIPCAGLGALLLPFRSLAWAPVPADSPPGRRPSPPALRWSLVALAWSTAGMIVAATAAVLAASLVSGWGADWSISLARYGAATAVFSRTALVVLIAAAWGTTLALLTAWVLERKHPALRAPALELPALAPAVLPGGLMGVGYVLAFGAGGRADVGIEIVAASIVVWTLPLALHLARAAFRRVPRDRGEAALSLGASPLAAALGIVMPLARWDVLAVVVAFVVSGVSTVGVVVFLSPSLAAPTALLHASAGDLERASALAMVLFASSLVGVGLVAVGRGGRAGRAGLSPLGKDAVR